MNAVKLYLLALLAGALFSVSNLQAQTYAKDQRDLHVGIGLLPTFYGSGFDGLIPPLSVSYEHGITDNIGVGGLIGFSTARYDYAGNDYYWRYTYILLGGRGAYHFDIAENPKLDTYAGLMLGYFIANASFHSDDPGVDEDLFDSPSAGGLGWSAFAGVRYQLKEKIGIYGELGYGLAILNAGVRFKL